MALRYRKRIKIARGLSLNLTGRGVGASAGPRGAKLSASSGGKSFLSLGRFGLYSRRRVR